MDDDFEITEEEFEASAADLMERHVMPEADLGEGADDEEIEAQEIEEEDDS